MRTVDLFCGCGGMSLGFQNAGFELVGAFDAWQQAVACYNANFNIDAQLKDLSKKNTSLAAIRPLLPEIIIGGPPCQDFSSAGIRSEGERADLTISFAKLVKSIKPRYFVMENVSQAQKSNAYSEAKTLLKKAGYGLTEKVLDASKCGVPQKRKRFFCIGALKAKDGFLDEYLEDNQSVLPLSVREYFEDNGYNIDFDFYYRHPRTYSRRAVFSVDEPAATIRGVNRPKPPEYVKHPNDASDPDGVSALTTRQRALIQTFPLDYVFDNNQQIAEQMIGNAVPVNLATHVANALMAYHEGHTEKQSISFSEWLAKKYGFSQLVAKDTISRLMRANRILPISTFTEKDYLNELEKTDEFAELKDSVKPQIKRAVHLYYEFIKRP